MKTAIAKNESADSGKSVSPFFRKGSKESLRSPATHPFINTQLKQIQPVIQRTVGDGHDLSSPRFAGDRILEAVYDNQRIISTPAQGQHIRKIQQALVDVGFPLPVYGVDGKFGNETKAAVKFFQQAKGLAVDGKVGPVTLTSLQDATTAPVPVSGAALAATPETLSSPLPAAVVRKWRQAVDHSNYAQAIRAVADEMIIRGEIRPAYYEVRQTSTGSDICTAANPSLFIVDSTVSGAVTSECSCTSTPQGMLANPRTSVGLTAITGSAESLHSILIHEFRHIRQQYERCNASGNGSGVCTDCNSPDEMDAYLAEVEAGYAPPSIRHAWVRVYVNWNYLALSQQNVFRNRKQAAQQKIDQLFPGVNWSTDASVRAYQRWCSSLAGGAVGTCNSFLAPLPTTP